MVQTLHMNYVYIEIFTLTFFISLQSLYNLRTNLYANRNNINIDLSL